MFIADGKKEYMLFLTPFLTWTAFSAAANGKKQYMLDSSSYMDCSVFCVTIVTLELIKSKFNLNQWVSLLASLHSGVNFFYHNLGKMCNV